MLPLFALHAAQKPAASDILVIDDFNDGRIGNNLKGDAGAWDMDASDEDQFCRASIEDSAGRTPGNKYLRLHYDVDSPKSCANGYWTQLRGLDARRYDHLELWVRGDGENGFGTQFKIEFKKPKRDEQGNVLEGEDLTGSFIVTGVTDQWQRIRVPLNVMNGILDWSELKELVIIFKDRMLDNKQGSLLIDDIALLRTGNPGPSIRDEVRRHVEKGIRGMDAKRTAEFLVQSRLGGFPAKAMLQKQFPADDREFLTTIAKDTWRFFEYFTDRHNGLPLDTIRLSSEDGINHETFIGDYTNVTNIGLYLMVLVSAGDLGFITAEEAQKRAKLTMETMDGMETAKGFHYNYYDTTTLERTSYFLSCVDSGWWAIGLYVAKNAFPELAPLAEKLLAKMDFSFFYDKVEGHMYHGFYTNIDYFSEYHYGSFYTEPRAVSYMAIGRGQAPMSHWFELIRTFPAAYFWQRQKPQHRVAKEVLGYRFFGGYYQYGHLRYVPSWGGSLFEALMPTMVLKERELAPKGLGVNDFHHTLVHVQEAKKLGYPVWGMSPCSVPGDGYSEFGVYDLGSKGYKPGVVTPHVTFLALEFAPAEAVANLRNMLANYPVYGECGFYDAVDPKIGKVAMKYLCLDQAMTLIAINNYLNNGAIRERFHAEPMFQKIEPLLSQEDFLNG